MTVSNISLQKLRQFLMLKTWRTVTVAAPGLLLTCALDDLMIPSSSGLCLISYSSLSLMTVSSVCNQSRTLLPLPKTCPNHSRAIWVLCETDSKWLEWKSLLRKKVREGQIEEAELCRRPRKVTSPGQTRRASKWQSQDWNPTNLTPESMYITTANTTYILFYYFNILLLLKS